MAFNQGVNFVPPTEPKPGELILARNSHYEPESETLFKVRGKTLFGTLVGGAATGLAYGSFRSGAKFLVGAAGTNYSAAVAGATGVFTSYKTLTSPAGAMEAVYVNGTDRIYVMDGVNAPQVWDGLGAMRAMGLTAPTSALTAVVLSNALTQYTLASTFQYCFTELDGVNNVESGPSPVIQFQTVIQGDTIKLTIPALKNGSTTKIRIYRTQAGGDVFFRLATVASTITTYYDGSNSEGALATRTDNVAVWGFATVDDIFLSAQPVLAMLGSPFDGTYISVNGTVPVGNILAVFEDSLIISGVSGYPQDVYYSMPDSPEQFSPIYFFREENARGEGVSAMGVANDRLIVFTYNSIFRHDTLPRVTDPSFGLASASRQLVTDDHGCAAKRTVVNYGVGWQNRLFYLSDRGPFSTDGYLNQPLGKDLDWSTRLVNVSALSGAVAVNYPRLFQIWLFVPSAGSTTNDTCYIYHYHPGHYKESGTGKWTGPLPARCNSAVVTKTVNSETKLYIADSNSTGNVYQADIGSSDGQNLDDPSGGIRWEVQTPDYTLGDQSQNKRVARIFLSMTTAGSDLASVRYALNQNDYERTVPVFSITKSQPSTQSFGTSQVSQVKTKILRGAMFGTGSSLRLHIDETGRDTRGLVFADAEVERYGPQR